MTQTVTRLRLFGGPNGSGKSTLKGMFFSEGPILRPFHLGVYLNPDDIEREWRAFRLRLAEYRIPEDETGMRQFLVGHPLVDRSGQIDRIASLKISQGVLDPGTLVIDSYLASALTEYFRRILLAGRSTFSFETVMSSRSKLDFLTEARQAGYRTYLYFVGTVDPDINVSRVQLRVAANGHSVPEDKIRSRYVNSMSLLYEAIQRVDRAYIFDNSGAKSILVAESEKDQLKVHHNVSWLQEYLLDRLQPAPL